MTCERCGQDHPKCKAHNRAGNPCGRNPSPGQNVCQNHGAAAPQNVAAAERRIARDRALGMVGELLAEMGEAPVPDPLTGLELAYASAHRMVAVLALLVGEQHSPLGINRHGEDVVHPLTALYGDWLDRYARVQKLALDAGIDERRAQVAEADIERLFGAVTAALDAAGLTPAQEADFRRALAGNLRALGSA